MPKEIFDFGFTAVDENELVQVEKSKATVEQTQAKLDEMYQAILPLLANLKKNPEKEFILWPDRLSKVEEFEKMLKGIYEE